MNILSIDTCSSALSAAVCRGDDVFYEQTEAGVRHSEIVMGFIDGIMKKASLTPLNLDMVLCMKGPGSFTGLRIGYSICKGLSLSLSIPFYAFSALDCVAFPFKSEERLVLPVIQATKNAWFFTLFRGTNRLFEDRDGGVSQILPETKKNNQKCEKIILTGPGASSFYNNLPQQFLNNFVFAGKTGGYAKELISIAKSSNLSDNYYKEMLFSGPEYIRG
jgi:tRNA threonylcarbamoyladenosine biosynthesis protein TsaB